MVHFPVCRVIVNLTITSPKSNQIFLESNFPWEIELPWYWFIIFFLIVKLLIGKKDWMLSFRHYPTKQKFERLWVLRDPFPFGAAVALFVVASWESINIGIVALRDSVSVGTRFESVEHKDCLDVSEIFEVADWIEQSLQVRVWSGFLIPEFGASMWGVGLLLMLS